MAQACFTAAPDLCGRGSPRQSENSHRERTGLGRLRRGWSCAGARKERVHGRTRGSPVKRSVGMGYPCPKFLQRPMSEHDDELDFDFFDDEPPARTVVEEEEPARGAPPETDGGGG